MPGRKLQVCVCVRDGGGATTMVTVTLKTSH